MSKIALFDMDGTLFDYELQLRMDIIDISSPFEDLLEIRDGDLWELAKKHTHIKRRMDLIKSQPGWWRKLPRFRPGWRLLDLAIKIGFCPKILTKGPRSKSRAWAEKVDCITDNFGEDMPIDIVGKDKKGTYGRVLVDDYPEYVQGWLDNRPRGLAILPAQPYNLKFEHPNAIIFHTENDENNNLVEKAMKAAFNRDTGQHWKDLC